MDITAYVIKNEYGEYFSFGVDYNPIWVNIYDAYYCASLDHAYAIVVKFGGEVYRKELMIMNIKPGDTVIITYCLEYPELTNKLGIVTDTQETGYGSDMLWLTIDGEEYMFFSDEVMLLTIRR